MMFELPWEKVGKNNKAIYEEIKTLRIGLGISRSFALSKMTEITAVSADFAEQRFSFYPLAWILFESSDKIEFFGLYSKEWEQDIIQDELPVAFLRKATWTNSIERQAYKAATTPEEYIRKHLLGENHVVSHNTFLNYENATPMLALASKIADKVEQGIKIDKADKCELYKPYLKDIRFHFANGCIDYDLDYNRFAYKSEELESWGKRWREHFDNVEIDLELNPTKKFRVFYKSSILDYFQRFKPYFTNVTYDED